MFYLTLYLCSKFSIAIPYLLPYAYTPEHSNDTDDTNHNSRAAHAEDEVAASNQSRIPTRRNQAAAPPAYLFIFALVPVSVATYIASSRYSDFRHHGFDIIFGSLMGILFSWVSTYLFATYSYPIALFP